MPFILSQGRRLSWRQDGLEAAPALLLLAPPGVDPAIWEPALPGLIEHFCVLRAEVDGQGGPYPLGAAAQDVLAVLDAAGRTSAFLCGLSFGGMIAMAAARLAPARIDGLILVSAQATMTPPSLDQLLSHHLPVTHPDLVEAFADGAVEAGPDADLGALLAAVAAPTLVLGGARDEMAPFVSHGMRLAAGIRGSRPGLLDTGHLACVDSPAAFSRAVADFVADLAPGGVQAARDTLYQAGVETRRKILGDAYVDRSLANMTGFNADFLAMATRYNWGEVWSRPGLDQRVRRFVVLTVTASLGRWEEFRLHVRLGLEQGVFTADELKELLLQLGVYAGIPVANTGFAEAAQILDSIAKADA